MKKYRIELDEYSFEYMKKIIHSFECSNSDDEYFKAEIMNAVNSPKEIKWSAKKANAAKDATQYRMYKTKQKILTTIDELKKQDKKITAYNIQKKSGVAFITAQKYLKSLDEIN